MADPTSAPPPTTPSSSRTLTYYHAGPLFTLADLTSNVALSQIISKLSSESPQSRGSRPGTPTSRYHFQPVLPQDLEPRVSSPSHATFIKEDPQSICALPNRGLQSLGGRAFRSFQPQPRRQCAIIYYSLKFKPFVIHPQHPPSTL